MRDLAEEKARLLPDMLWHFRPGCSPGTRLCLSLTHEPLASAREALAVCMLSCSWLALSAAAANYEPEEPGAGHSYLAGLAASLHRSAILATYRSLEQREQMRDPIAGRSLVCACRRPASDPRLLTPGEPGSWTLHHPKLLQAWPPARSSQRRSALRTDRASE